MASASLKQRIAEAMKAAMRARDRARRDAIRLIQAEIQRVEVDERISADDDRVLGILDRMTKQRRDAIAQYERAARPDLAARERAEIDVIADFLPAPLTDAEIDALIDAAVTATGATTARDLGRVMAVLKPQLQGRADLGAASARVKLRLS